MIKRGPHKVIVCVVILSVTSALLLTACSSDTSQAKALIAEYLTGQGVTDIVIDTFHRSRNASDKAYVSATVTYNFATSSGTPQREFLGFILTRADNRWRIERATFYTKEIDKAERYIAGGK